MGCDIHMYVERRTTKKNGTTQWSVMEGPSPWREDAGIRVKEDWLWWGRNYNLFALLADVRNDGSISPISDPRGLPPDVSKYVQGQSDSWDCDGHSHSYLTLRELLDFDWEGETFIERGVVNEQNYKLFKEQGQPDSWSGGIWGLSVRRISNKEMDGILSGAIKKEEGITYATEVEWEVTYGDATGGFHREAIPKLQALGDPDDIRIVFWFDN